MLQIGEGDTVLEIGCGDGRFTVLMAQLGADVLAVDLSIEGLRRVGRNAVLGTAPTSFEITPRRRSLVGHIGRVQADASTLQFTSKSFNRALSATPLDTRHERMKLYSAIAEALTDDGRYVCGVDYDDLYRRLLGLPVVRRYGPGGILIEHQDLPELRRETGAYFANLQTRIIRAHLPMMKHVPLRLAVPMIRLAGAVPLLKHFGEIALLAAQRPIRVPLEGTRRPGYLGAQKLYRWYKRRRGQEPIWTWGEEV